MTDATPSSRDVHEDHAIGRSRGAVLEPDLDVSGTARAVGPAFARRRSSTRRAEGNSDSRLSLDRLALGVHAPLARASTRAGRWSHEIGSSGSPRAIPIATRRGPAGDLLPLEQWSTPVTFCWHGKRSHNPPIPSRRCRGSMGPRRSESGCSRGVCRDPQGLPIRNGSSRVK
jgi:hypothetical protein